jgi:hypothetical protein
MQASCAEVRDKEAELLRQGYRKTLKTEDRNPRLGDYSITSFTHSPESFEGAGGSANRGWPL